MIEVAIACAAIGALSCIIFALMCIPPANRMRSAVVRLQSNPALLAAIAAQDSGQTLESAAITFEPAARRLGAAGLAIENALASVAGYTNQVAVTASLVESLLGLVVPRLRGMLANEEETSLL